MELSRRIQYFRDFSRETSSACEGDDGLALKLLNHRAVQIAIHEMFCDMKEIQTIFHGILQGLPVGFH